MLNRIEGQTLLVPDAVITCQQDGRGGLIPINVDGVVDCHHPCWLQLNHTYRESAKWMSATQLIPDSARAALCGDSQRPCVTRLGDSAFLTSILIKIHALTS